jgi:hypothetical protein
MGGGANRTTLLKKIKEKIIETKTTGYRYAKDTGKDSGRCTTMFSEIKKGKENFAFTTIKELCEYFGIEI